MTRLEFILDMQRLVATLALVLFAQVVAVNAQPLVEFLDNGRGPVPLYLPSAYSDSENLPLVVALHGFTQSGSGLENYIDLTAQIESSQFLYLVPEGRRNPLNQRYWNATDACCDFVNSGVDDSGYLRDLVDLVRDEYAVNDRSIHFLGYSNGGFMAHRMAIDHADLVASIVSLAGANFSDAAAYSPSEPVNILQVHGTADTVIRYNGGNIVGVPYPSAEQTVLNWVDYNGLEPIPQTVGTPFDLDRSVPGNETTSQVYDVNNESDTTVELWTLGGAGHGPNFGDGTGNLFAPRVVNWMLSNPKLPSCDFNLDGSCDILDIDLLIAEIAAGTDDSAFDLDGNDMVNIVDRDAWLAESGELNLASGAPYFVADMNLDGTVDGDDFIAWNANKFSSTGRWSLGDVDGDGVTDGADFVAWNENKFRSADDVPVVPEPGGWLLASLGIAAIVAGSRQQ